MPRSPSTRRPRCGSGAIVGRSKFFGGVPEWIRVASAKCAITGACAGDPEVWWAHRRPRRGIRLHHRPFSAERPEKERSRRGGREIPQAQLRAPARVSRPRQHQRAASRVGPRRGQQSGPRDDHERPLARSTKQRALLRCLPHVAQEPAARAAMKGHSDDLLRFEKSRYSVPYQRSARRSGCTPSPTPCTSSTTTSWRRATRRSRGQEDARPRRSPVTRGF